MSNRLATIERADSVWLPILHGGSVQPCIRRFTNSAHPHRIGYEREGCSRAIDVVLHRGRPAQPDRPDNFSVHLNGEPPPHAATRASVGIPAKSDGSPWMKLKKSCVETPNRAV